MTYLHDYNGTNNSWTQTTVNLNKLNTILTQGNYFVLDYSRWSDMTDFGISCHCNKNAYMFLYTLSYRRMNDLIQCRQNCYCLVNSTRGYSWSLRNLSLLYLVRTLYIIVDSDGLTAIYFQVVSTSICWACSHTQLSVGSVTSLLPCSWHTLNPCLVGYLVLWTYNKHYLF